MLSTTRPTYPRRMTTDDPARLITEADRQRALTVLRRAAEDGRLTPTALDERSRRVREVLLVGQLDDVLEGLRPDLWHQPVETGISTPGQPSQFISDDALCRETPAKCRNKRVQFPPAPLSNNTMDDNGFHKHTAAN